MDKITIERIAQAHPIIREELRAQYEQANNMLGKNVRLRFAYVYRSPDEQRRLFLKKPRVTNADAWQSIHNYGLAFDIVLLIDKNNDGIFEEVSYDMLKDSDGDKIADWMEIVNFFKQKGWTWGGDWKKLKDAPHFEKNFGHDWRSLKEKIDKNMVIRDKNGINYPTL